MKTYTQYGIFSIISLLAAAVICVGLLLIIGPHEVFPVIIAGFVILTFLICLLIFYKLTIKIDDTYLSFSLGVGMVRRKYRLSDIESCKPVKNSVMWGVGIRMIPGGWLYNVSGMEAVELRFKNSRKRIRIGTDKAGEVAEEVNSRLLHETSGSFYEKGRVWGAFIFIAILFAVTAFIMIMVVNGKREPEITLADSHMTISGMYGLNISYSDILQADTMNVLPGIKARTNGFAAGGVLKGHFKLSDGTKVLLFLDARKPPFIFIKTKDNAIYFNLYEADRTRELFNKLKGKYK